MTYTIRVLTPSSRVIPVPEMRAWLQSGYRLEADEARNRGWVRMFLTHANGQEVAAIERRSRSAVLSGRHTPERQEGGRRSATVSGNPVENDIRHFLQQIAECRPPSAVQWLQGYLPRIQVIYSFGINNNGVRIGDGWQALHRLYFGLHRTLGGVLQADQEGFSNEDGLHILWQFDEQASGEFEAAVLQEGTWMPFRMDLANHDHRKAFQGGRVPEGVEVIGR